MTYEANSLRAAKWANVFMGTAGVSAAVMSNSNALMVDGVFSFVNFMSVIVAGRVGQRIARGPDKYRPFGYAAEESLYTALRSMVLTAVILFALLSALVEITNYALTGNGKELILGPIVIYMLSMVAICFGLAAYHGVNLKRSGGNNSILKLERQSAIIDGLMSAGSGAALLALPLLKGTALAPIIPVGDSLIVAVLCVFMVFAPVRGVKSGFAELLGIITRSADLRTARHIIAPVVEEWGGALVDVLVTHLGRSPQVIAYVTFADNPAFKTRRSNTFRLCSSKHLCIKVSHLTNIKMPVMLFDHVNAGTHILGQQRDRNFCVD